MKEKIVVLDFESKNLHLITKRLRKLQKNIQIIINQDENIE